MMKKAIAMMVILMAVAATVFAQAQTKEHHYGLALDIPKKVTKELQGVAEALPGVFKRNPDEYWDALAKEVNKVESDSTTPAEVVTCMVVFNYNKNLAPTGFTYYVEVWVPSVNNFGRAKTKVDMKGKVISQKVGPDAFNDMPKWEDCFAEKFGPINK